MALTKILIAGFLMLPTWSLFAQNNKWQQRADYKIEAALDVETNLITGKEIIKYQNNSPDTLDKVFMHLFWNAFQPGSMMDEHSRRAGELILGRDKKGNVVRDWDGRVADRISKLAPNEQGYQKIRAVRVNGYDIVPEIQGTVMKLLLTEKLLPQSSISVEIAFEAQVPVQIRRSGRDNAEGVRYSIAQWYPKIAGYDQKGWHAFQYVAREFYAPFGSYDVQLTVDKNYLVAGTGTVTNPDQVGFGYGRVKGVPKSANQNTIWKFRAHNVHDFVWAADDQFVLLKRKLNNGPLLYFVYKKKDNTYAEKWSALADTITMAYPFIERTFGAYKYPNYSFIQGGDGGMEYPMATLIKTPSIGTAIHEWGHNWFQGTIASNEITHPWMDEGGATYLERRTTGFLHKDTAWYLRSYGNYYDIVAAKMEEPLTTYADNFVTNYAYSIASYVKGFIFYEQLSYILGNANMDSFLLEYENRWKFRHPEPADMLRVAEDVSGLQLQWYKDFWVKTTKVIDYAIASVTEYEDTTRVELRNDGTLPMPVDVLVKFKNGALQMYNIPSSFMYGHKPAENNYYEWIFCKPWNWTNTKYILQLPIAKSQIQSIEIDPSKRMADINQKNNLWKNK